MVRRSAGGAWADFAGVDTIHTLSWGVIPMLRIIGGCGRPLKMGAIIYFLNSAGALSGFLPVFITGWDAEL